MRVYKNLRLVVVAAVMSLVALPAFAGHIEARFGNTMLATRPSGTTMKLWYNKDHTYTGELQAAGAPMVMVTSGKWRVDGDKVCVAPDNPPGSEAAPKRPETCAPLKGDKVGDTWETQVKDIDGKSVTQTVAIVKGR
ncbi:MAG: hypothetical protein ACOH12_07695 [Parvibaculaceae bacterium]